MHEKFVARRVRKGYAQEQSKALLFQLLESHDGDNLVHALCYNDFATERQAEKFVSMVSEGGS